MATTTTTKVLIHDLQEPRNFLFSLLQYYLTDFWAEVGDPRVGELPFMGTFALPLAIYFSYFLFVLVLGPALMRHRRPLSLKWTLVGYNLTMALFNLAIFVKVLLASNFGRRMLELDWKDQGDRSEHALSARRWAWLYVLSKYVDMLDTVFFVLRKKESQITGG